MSPPSSSRVRGGCDLLPWGEEANQSAPIFPSAPVRSFSPKSEGVWYSPPVLPPGTSPPPPLTESLISLLLSSTFLRGLSSSPLCFSWLPKKSLRYFHLLKMYMCVLPLSAPPEAPPLPESGYSRRHCFAGFGIGRSAKFSANILSVLTLLGHSLFIL